MPCSRGIVLFEPAADTECFSRTRRTPGSLCEAEPDCEGALEGWLASDRKTPIMQVHAGMHAAGVQMLEAPLDHGPPLCVVNKLSCTLIW